MRFAITRLMSAATFAACVAMPAAWAGEINFWVTEPLKAKAEQVISAFEKENPDIKVRMQFSPYGGLESKVMIALRSGNPPDLVEVQTSWIPSYQATNTLEGAVRRVLSDETKKSLVCGWRGFAYAAQR